MGLLLLFGLHGQKQRAASAADETEKVVRIIPHAVAVDDGWILLGRQTGSGGVVDRAISWFGLGRHRKKRRGAAQKT
jgi:hypothetical protein